MRAGEPAEGAHLVAVALRRDDLPHERRERPRSHHQPLDWRAAERLELPPRDAPRGNAGAHHRRDVRRTDRQRDSRGAAACRLEPARAPPAVAGHHADPQHQPQPRIDDEERVAIVPIAAHRHEPADAVGVEGVEQRMGEDGDDREEQHFTRQDAGREHRAAHAANDPVEADDRAGQQKRQHHQRGDSVGPAAPEREIGGGPVEVGEDVDVGQVGADEERRGSQGGALPEAAPRQRGADQRMADRVYASLASNSIGTLPLSACDTGQPSFAFSAAALNPASSRPGTSPRTSSRIRVMRNPSPTFSMVQAAVVLMRCGRSLGRLEAGGQRHAETGRVRGRDQLFGVGALLALEAGAERVVAAEGAGGRGEVAAPGAQPAFPDGAGATGGQGKPPVKVAPVSRPSR